MINLHILNAHGRFTPYQKQIEAGFARSVQRVSEILPISSIDVVFYFDPESVLPFGLGGYSPSEHQILISADPDNANFVNSLEQEFVTLLGHEFHHSMRWRTVGYGNSLLEALVSEGLACHFETELRPSIVPFYAAALEEEAISDWLVQATQSFSDTDYGHAEWFLGHSDEIPLYTGYTLGFELVSRYICQQNRKASSLYAEPAEHFRTVV